MKNFLLLIYSVLLFSCGGSEKQTDFSNLSIKIDTVMVDSKDEILFLQMGFRWSDVSSDGKYFYNFNINKHALELINLETLAFEEHIYFEKEGPNGTGNRFGQIYSIGKDSLYFSSQFRHDVFDLKGKKLISHSTRNMQFSEGEFNADESIPNAHMRSKNPNQIFGFGKSWKSGETSFLKIDFSSKTLKRWELPEFEILKSYYYHITNPQINFIPSSFSSIVGDKVLLSIGVSGDIYFYDIEKEEMTLKSPNLNLTAKEKTRKPPKQLSNMEEYREVDQMLREQINFQHPIWDSKSKCFYRFSYVEVFPSIESENDSGNDIQAYLTVFDEQFSIIGEQALPSLKIIPNHAFIKDEDIWIPVNLEDEMGFVRIKIN